MQPTLSAVQDGAKETAELRYEPTDRVEFAGPVPSDHGAGIVRELGNGAPSRLKLGLPARQRGAQPYGGIA
jgi:hypothetical protein